jgi:hypothetical protein
VRVHLISPCRAHLGDHAGHCNRHHRQQATDYVVTTPPVRVSMPNCMERHDQADNCHDHADDCDPAPTTSRVSLEVVVRAWLPRRVIGDLADECRRSKSP